MPTVINGTTGVSQVQDNTITSAKIVDLTIQPGDVAQKMTLMTQQNATGSNVDFTGIPSWAKVVTVMLNAVSTNGTLVPGVQFGTVTSVEATGYIGAMFVSSGTAIGNLSLSSMLPFHSANDATQVYSGIILITVLSPNVYSFSANIGGSSGRITVIGGSKTLASVLTTVRLTTGGADLFDAGSINIMYEG